MISAITIRPIAPRGPVSRGRPSRANVPERYFSARLFFIFFEVSAREAPRPIFRTPPVSERPHSSARGVHKQPEPRQIVSERCHSPSHTALSKLFYMPLSDCPSKPALSQVGRGRQQHLASSVCCFSEIRSSSPPLLTSIGSAP
jgi:hypothetical protein